MDVAIVDFLRERQEREYRRLAGSLGFGNDPQRAFWHLSGRRSTLSADEGASLPDPPTPFWRWYDKHRVW